MDANGDGKVTKSELTSALTASGEQASPSDVQKSVDTIFKMLDSSGKGYITEQDAAVGLEKLDEAGKASASKTEGSSKARGGGGGGEGSASTTLDPADTNQDGTVSAAEEMAYILSQYQNSDAAQQSKSLAYA